MLRIKADQYRVSISRQNQSTISDTTTPWREEIIVNGKLSDDPEGETWQAFLFFVDDLSTAPSNSQSTVLPRVFIFMSREQFNDCLDLLRNEQPVFVAYNDRSPNYSGLVTDGEPVGEGESPCCGEQDGANDVRPIRPPRQQAFAYDNLELASSSHSWANSSLLGLASYYVYGD